MAQCARNSKFVQENMNRVLSLLEACFNLILCSSLSMKVQIMGWKITAYPPLIIISWCRTSSLHRYNTLQINMAMAQCAKNSNFVQEFKFCSRKDEYKERQHSWPLKLFQLQSATMKSCIFFSNVSQYQMIKSGYLSLIFHVCNMFYHIVDKLIENKCICCKVVSKSTYGLVTYTGY